MFSFVHLHVHSCYSFGDGPDWPGALCEAAARGGQRALALTDTNGLYGAVRFAEAARAAGLRPILGAQLKAGRSRAVVLPLDGGGLRGLFGLIRDRHALGEAFDLCAALVRRGPGLAVVSDDEDLVDAVLKGRGADDLYVEVWPRGRAPRARRERLRDLAVRAGIPAVATGGVHFARPEGHPLHRALRALGSGCAVGALAPSASAPAEAWLWPAARMAQGFEEHPELLANAAALADRCRAKLTLEGLRPYRPAEAQTAGGVDGLPASTDGGLDGVTALKARCETVAANRWGAPLPRPVRRRLVEELDLLATSGLSAAMLALGDLGDLARDASIPMAARGSAAGSLVLHLLGLASVDPLRHDLGFARFFEAGRSWPPDVDLDVGWRGRRLLMDLAQERFGGDRAVRAGRLVSLRLTRERLALAGVDGPTAAALTGLPERLAAHPSALALLPDPVDWLMPTEPVGPEAVVVSQWDARTLRRTGLLVLDLLGNRAISVVHGLETETDRAATDRAATEGHSAAQATPEPPLPPASLERALPPTTPEEALDDPRVQTLVREGRTLGCYHLESPPMRALVRRLGTADFDTLAAAAALVRPGAERAGLPDRLVHCARGTQGWRSARRPLLVFQDDLIAAARRRAGFSRQEAEHLCAALRRPGGVEDLADLQGRFIQACLDSGEASADAHSLWDQVATFSGASFCKAHCAASVALGLRGAWHRAHHPAAFLAAVLAQGAGYYPREAYLSEARRLGLTLVGPCVNRSGASFGGHGTSLRLGLAQIRNLGGRAVNAILESRAADGPFDGEADLARRARLTPRDLDLLLRAGALPQGGLQGRDRAGLMVPLGSPGAALGSSRETSAEEETPTVVRRLRRELKTFGILLSGHPLDLVDQPPQGLVQAADLGRHNGASVALAGWLVCVRRIVDQGGQPMAFATFEDPSDLFDTLVDPQIHARVSGPLDRSPGPYVVHGRVSRIPGSRVVRMKELTPL